MSVRRKTAELVQAAPGWTEFWMFTVAAIALAIVGAICVGSLLQEDLPEGLGTLLGGAVTGLLLVARDVVKAIQARWGVPSEDAPAPVREGGQG